MILATPIGGIHDLLQLFGPELEAGTIVTDTGSTKVEVLRWAEEYLPSAVDFVGGHPMAGKELSGPEAAEADLFQDATYCIIPGNGADQVAVRVVTQMAEVVGAKPYFIDAAEHDSYVAAVSHLPLVLSTVLVRLNSGNPAWPEVAKLASGGFRDVSRLAAGSPEMSRDYMPDQPGIDQPLDRPVHRGVERLPGPCPGRRPAELWDAPSITPGRRGTGGCRTR